MSLGCRLFAGGGMVPSRLTPTINPKMSRVLQAEQGLAFVRPTILGHASKGSSTNAQEVVKAQELFARRLVSIPAAVPKRAIQVRSIVYALRLEIARTQTLISVPTNDIK